MPRIFAKISLSKVLKICLVLFGLRIVRVTSALDFACVLFLLT